MELLNQREKDIFHKGMIHAAAIADDYNSCTAHSYRLGDCILAKLNQLPKSKIRKNKKRLPAFYKNNKWIWKGE